MGNETARPATDRAKETLATRSWRNAIQGRCLREVFAAYLKKRIGSSFLADRAGRPMSADYRDVVPQGQELVLDRLEQSPVIASGEIGAANRASEQHVADDC